jgi:hypothetical protein
LSDLPSPQVGGGNTAPPEISESQFAEFAEGLLDERPKRPSQPRQAPQQASDAPAREQPGHDDPVPGPEDPAPSDDEEELPDEPDEAAEADDSDHQGVEPPNGFTRAEKELFDQLPLAAQQMIARRESDRDRAFVQKTQEIAEHRKALESTFHEIGAERQRYAENLEQLLFVAAPEAQRFAQIDWQRLATEQPAEYVKMTAERDALRGRIGTIQQQLEGVRAQQQQMQAYEFQERRQAEAQRLVEKIPDFADAEKGPKKIQEMRQFLARQGFSPQEIGQAIDHRMLVVTDMAMRLERMQNARKQAETKQNGRAPSVQRPGSPRQGSDSRAAQRRAEKMAALSKSGSEKDAISYLLEVI